MIVNSGTVQSERNGDEARVATGGNRTQGTEVTHSRQGATVQAKVSDESRLDVSVHDFWKWGTTALFDIQIDNLDAGS